MIRQSKRVFSFALVGIFVLFALLGGCTPAAQPTVAEVVDTPAAGEPAASEIGIVPTGNITMTFWDPSTDEGINAIFTQMFDSFSAKYPNIRVENTHQGDYVKKLNTAFAADSTPDLIWAWANPLTFYDYVEKGLLKDLSAEYEHFGWKEYFPEAMYNAVLGPDGKPYGVPTFINGTVIAYNADMFEQYGLSEPQNYEELMAAMETLQENGVTPMGLGLSDGNWQAKRLFEVILNATAGKEWTEALYRGENSWTDPKVVDALTRLETIGDYIAEGSLGMNSRQGWDLWYQGQAAMIVSDTWQFSLHDRDATFKWGFFPFPPSSDEASTTFVGAVSDVLYIPKSSNNVDAAVLFLDHFLTPEVQGYWIEAGLPFAAGDHFGLITEEKMGAANVELMEYINENGYTTWFDVGNPSEIAGELAPVQLAGVLNKQITPEAAAQAIEDVAKPLFGR